MAIIKTTDLTKIYKSFKSVDTLSLEIEEGEVFGLLGPNGAGKTTTIKMLATLLEPSSGTATVNGFDIVKEPAKVRQSIGIVFQEPSSDELLTGEENLLMHSMIYGIPYGERKKRIDYALELVELEAKKNQLVKTYSGGMRRRLEIARGLLHKPKVLFLDEPTLGLDPVGRATMWKYIKQLVKELKMTILLTTHYMEEADELCDRLCIIDKGKAVAIDTPKNLKKTVGGDTIIIKCENFEQAKIAKLPFVKGIERTGNKFKITVENITANLQTLLNTTGQVQYVEVKPTTLEDVFRKYTGKGLETAENSFWDKIVQQEINKQ